MPESKRRKKDTYTPPPSKNPVKIGSPRWVAPVMLACFILGLLWIVAYYIAPQAPIMSDLSYWERCRRICSHRSRVHHFHEVEIDRHSSTKWK